MTITRRDVGLWAAALLAFPLAMNLTALNASEEAPVQTRQVEITAGR